ncbi:MAG: adenylosuccinate lyase [Chloroflexia bacterium]|nr:adenylosuccinate lyase [Chloroflexia bacterium]
MFDHGRFHSPFSWRYGSDEMRQIWSEEQRRRLLRRVWVALARAQSEAGLVRPEQVADLEAHQDKVDIEHALQIEAHTHHDLMAELLCFAEQAPLGGPILHLGATSMDIEDNADVLRQHQALALILQRLAGLLEVLADQVEARADQVCMGWTHLQPAEPTTVGYRLALYAQDLLADYEDLRRLQRSLRGKGIKGAVGTCASYAQLLQGSGMSPAQLERRVMELLGLEAFALAHQTYPRRQDWSLLVGLAGLGMALYRFAFDLRFLQSPPIGEWGEPFGQRQVGSSAMPFKRNPVQAENVDSLARLLAALPRVAWDNAAHCLLERTLDDSGNRRETLPVAFLTAEELLLKSTRLLRELRLDDWAIVHNLERYGTFAASERLLMELVKAGADRQAMHEIIRQHSMAAWEDIRAGRRNPLAQYLAGELQILHYLPQERVRQLLHADEHVGDAPERARAMAGRVRQALES